MIGPINMNYFALGCLVLCVLVYIVVANVFQGSSRVRPKSGLSGKEAAEKILAAYGIDDVEIREVDALLEDNYDPRQKVLFLSPDVMAQRSVSAVAFAAHECGHILQEKEGAELLGLRKLLLPVCKYGSIAAYVLAAVGYAARYYWMIPIGTVLFSVITLMNVLTLPVEAGATKKASAAIAELGLLNEEERKAGGRVAAAAGFNFFVAQVFPLVVIYQRAALFSRK